MISTSEVEVCEEAPGMTLTDLISDIAACSNEVEREQMIDDFLRATESITKSIGAALCRDFKADRNTWLDDFCQCVRIAAHKLITEVTSSPEKFEEMESYRALLRFRSRSAVTAFVDSSAGFNQASGQAGLKRRRRELERTRATLYAELCREPSDEEIVDVTNVRMRATRVDAARQGMICKTEDLHIADTAEDIDNHVDLASRDTVETDSDLHATERKRLVLMCIAACDAESPQLGQIARLLLAPALGDGYDDLPTAAAIAKLVGIEASTARAKVSRVKQVSQRVARDQFGIREVARTA